MFTVCVLNDSTHIIFITIRALVKVWKQGLDNEEIFVCYNDTAKIKSLAVEIIYTILLLYR